MPNGTGYQSVGRFSLAASALAIAIADWATASSALQIAVTRPALPSLFSLSLSQSHSFVGYVLLWLIAALAADAGTRHVD